MSTLNFKTHTKNIREEALQIGFSLNTMTKYESIWKQFIKWKKEDNFIYSSEEYKIFLLARYKFDVNTYTSNSKSRHKQLMRSKRILDDFDSYKVFMLKRSLPNALYYNYPELWDNILDKYLEFCKNIQLNSIETIKEVKRYLSNIFSYFYQNNVKNINEITKINLITFINEIIEKGEVSKRRYFYYLKGFLKYLFIEDILKEDLSIYIPKIKKTKRKKVPTYLKQNDIETLLNSIPKNKKNEIRDYTIILIASRLGLRISDILNIKIKDIDWKNYKINVVQPKTKNSNVLPLSKEVGWAIIDYIKKSRPKCSNEYLFVKMKYPFDKMNSFYNFNKYFDKIDIEINDENKKGIHNLRHSLATNMLNNDIPLSIISSTLGHKSMETTSVYLKVDLNNLKKCGLDV